MSQNVIPKEAFPIQNLLLLGSGSLTCLRSRDLKYGLAPNLPTKPFCLRVLRELLHEGSSKG
jgi:hypothetical protein